MVMRLVPLFNRVLVEKIIRPSKTNTGILLPETSAKLNSGKVIAVGPGVHDEEGKLIPVAIKKSDAVLLPEYGGTEHLNFDSFCCGCPMMMAFASFFCSSVSDADMTLISTNTHIPIIQCFLVQHSNFLSVSFVDSSLLLKYCKVVGFCTKQMYHLFRDEDILGTLHD
ncbi:10 kDa chaperonin [Spatholobus suberectus]|nr:10 kDa chaperonin [Spatholobus suberectus]